MELQPTQVSPLLGSVPPWAGTPPSAMPHFVYPNGCPLRAIFPDLREGPASSLSFSCFAGITDLGGAEIAPVELQPPQVLQPTQPTP